MYVYVRISLSLSPSLYLYIYIDANKYMFTNLFFLVVAVGFVNVSGINESICCLCEISNKMSVSITCALNLVPDV